MGDVDALNYLNNQKRTNAEWAAEWIEIESLSQVENTSQQFVSVRLIMEPVNREDNCTDQSSCIPERKFKSNQEGNASLQQNRMKWKFTNFISDKTKAIEILESVEDTVKGCNEAVWHCYILKGQIQLNYLNDLVATKKIIDTLSSVADVPVHWNGFSLAISYFHRVVDDCNDKYRRLAEEFQNEKEKFQNEKENFQGEIERLNNEIEKLRENFEERLLAVQTEIEAKFTTEAIRNFEEVINSQTEVSNLRKLNDRLLAECSQLRNERNSLEDDKTKLEAKLESIITEQEQQKKALMLMGALLDKLSLKNDDDDKSSPSNKTG